MRFPKGKLVDPSITQNHRMTGDGRDFLEGT